MAHALRIFATLGLFFGCVLSGLISGPAIARSTEPTAQSASTIARGASSARGTPAAANLSRGSAVQKTVLFLGDSLTEGYGVKKDEAFPEIAGRILRERSYNIRIVNGGISGSVSADADRRLKWFLKTKPDILVLALGANDALKGTPVDVIKKNLGAAVDLAKGSGMKVLLCGIQVFSNFGPEYGRGLAGIYRDLAREKKVSLMPFLLEDVALKKELNQSDMKHPNPKGHEIVGRHVADELEKLL